MRVQKVVVYIKFTLSWLWSFGVDGVVNVLKVETTSVHL